MAGRGGDDGHWVRAKDYRHPDHLADIASVALRDTGVVSQPECDITQSESDFAERSSHSSPSAAVHL